METYLVINIPNGSVLTGSESVKSSSCRVGAWWYVQKPDVQSAHSFYSFES